MPLNSEVDPTMPFSTTAPLVLLGLLLALPSCSSKGPDGIHVNTEAPVMKAGSVRSFHFDVGEGSPPQSWIVSTTNRREGSEHAHWEQRMDSTAPSAPNVLALTDARGHVGQAFNLCWTDTVSLADVDIEVAVRTDGGREDQGGGPAWRIAGESDYYTARWNPLEDNFRVYSVKGGERLQLDSARVLGATGEWHKIRVRHVGDSITCWFDGVELLHGIDGKLRGAGGVGVWTKADATTRFDDLSVKVAESGH